MTDLFEADVATTTTSLDLRRLQRQKRRATRRKWALVMVSVGLVLFAFGGSIAYNFLQDTFSSDVAAGADDYEGLGQGQVQVIVEPGDTGAQIAETLYADGVVASVEAFTAEYTANPDSQNIMPGYYIMQREMKAQYALTLLLDPNNRELRKITIPEGKTLAYYYQKIADLTGASIDDVQAAATDTEAIGLPAEAGGNLEGWLFPATYEFNPGTTPTAVMQEMIKQTVSVLNSNGVAPADYERILTIASLVEKEAKLPEDRPLIAGVIYNRLNADWKLEFDSTVKYVAPSEGVFTSDEDRNTDSPYNTYKYPGLPPGPIAAPGAASIEAAVAPAQHDYFYFVTVNLTTGETAYATTFQEHQANVQRLQQWVRDNQSTDG